jgi:hypothetical protein
VQSDEIVVAPVMPLEAIAEIVPIAWLGVYVIKVNEPTVAPGPPAAIIDCVAGLIVPPVATRLTVRPSSSGMKDCPGPRIVTLQPPETLETARNVKSPAALAPRTTPVQTAPAHMRPPTGLLPGARLSTLGEVYESWIILASGDVFRTFDQAQLKLLLA